LRQGCIIVLDVGKSLAKLTLWSPERQLMDRRTRANIPTGTDYPSLDVAGITNWLETGLKDFGRQGNITAIIPVGHGAAACIIDGDGLCLTPLDYEAEIPADLRARYLALRDPFSLTGSPALPAGLNLGAQLFWLDAIKPEATRRGRIVTWPQYWAWLLSGVAATEVTSLGCHSDLWLPRQGRPSPLALSRGWADQLAPLRRAGDVLGPVTEDWRNRCGLPADCMVLCGLHDSNAALLAARLYPETEGTDCTVLSTGTWFVAMRPGVADAALAENRDCLVMADAFGAPIAASRFMGGREAEMLEQGLPIDPAGESDALLGRAQEAITAGVMALPAFQLGVGPFPERTGNWIARPGDQVSRRAVAGLYLALMADASLSLIGSRERLVIEGRFAGDPVFTRTLAALRPDQAIYLSAEEDNVPLGALTLVDGRLAAGAVLTRAQPLAAAGLKDYAAAWRARAGQNTKKTQHQGA
jgi:sugar (pentulose or hexulose) kinase